MENTTQTTTPSPAETRAPNYLQEAFAACLASRDHANEWDVTEWWQMKRVEQWNTTENANDNQV